MPHAGNFLGGLKASRFLAATRRPDNQKVPNITRTPRPASAAGASTTSSRLLASGQKPDFDSVGGAMKEVVGGTKTLSDADAAPSPPISRPCRRSRRRKSGRQQILARLVRYRSCWDLPGGASVAARTHATISRYRRGSRQRPARSHTVLHLRNDPRRSLSGTGSGRARDTGEECDRLVNFRDPASMRWRREVPVRPLPHKPGLGFAVAAFGVAIGGTVLR